MSKYADSIDVLNLLCNELNLPLNVRSITLRAAVDEGPTVTYECVLTNGDVEKVTRALRAIEVVEDGGHPQAGEANP